MGGLRVKMGLLKTAAFVMTAVSALVLLEGCASHGQHVETMPPSGNHQKAQTPPDTIPADRPSMTCP